MAKTPIPKSVYKFADASSKKYIKKMTKHSMMALSKKDAEENFYLGLLDRVPEVLEWIVYRTWRPTPEAADVKEACIDKLGNGTFIKVLTREIKSGNKVKNVKLFPVVFKELLDRIHKENEKNIREYEAALAAYEKSGNKKDKPEQPKIYEDADIVVASKLCSKKLYKKLCEVCTDDDMAFDILSVFSTTDLVTTEGASHFYRYNLLLETLYAIAKTKKVDFEAIVNTLLGKETMLYPVFATHILLERKDRYNRLTESQKNLWNNITEWAVNTLESSDKKIIKSSLDRYIERRKSMTAGGKDGPRRIVLSSLTENDYPKLVKIINALITKDDENKKYL